MATVVIPGSFRDSEHMRQPVTSRPAQKLPVLPFTITGPALGLPTYYVNHRTRIPCAVHDVHLHQTRSPRREDEPLDKSHYLTSHVRAVTTLARASEFQYGLTMVSVSLRTARRVPSPKRYPSLPYSRPAASRQLLFERPSVVFERPSAATSPDVPSDS